MTSGDSSASFIPNGINHNPTPIQTGHLNAISEWLNSDSINYVVGSLNACENVNMLADLRQIFPREALIEASRYVRGVQRQRLQEWLNILNKQVK